MICILGDIHGKFEAIQRAMTLPGVSAWLQVGDLGGEKIAYPDLPAGFWFIKGNHENWELLSSTPRAPGGPYLENGYVYNLPLDEGRSIVVAAFGGNYSPVYWDHSKPDVPISKHKHFLSEEVDSLMESQAKVDILLTHEAPSPYMIKGTDCGKQMITALSAGLQPRLHAFGHHHRYGVYRYGGVKTVGLSFGWSDCILWDENTGEHEWKALP